jgi:hypothetical protein
MQDPEYLSRNRIEIIDKKGEAVNPEDIDWEELTAEKFPYRFRQETGEDNSLGLLKVEIKNPLGYLSARYQCEVFIYQQPAMEQPRLRTRTTTHRSGQLHGRHETARQ